ncbi:MAG: tRNA pseudouridine(38-40) synthase TruA [Halobacteriovoraceae bacterium]|nr:tRNA pseudouridine(38-40) synthase TruA [Halobacteriovoraceae bacterium]
MIYYKIFLTFKGSRFLGWQKQKDFHPAAQGELEGALRTIFKSNSIHTIGSGRTDTGVHSLSHVVKLRAPFEIPPKSLVRALNSNLADDIRVLDAAFCEESFRPTNDAIKKEYKYLFTTNLTSSPFQKDLMANYPYELDFEQMRQACKLFIGQHDFKNFSCVGSEPSSTIREIFECEVTSDIAPNLQGILPNYHMVRIVGNGFLKQMVRLVVGTLWHVGRGKLDKEVVKTALSGREIDRIGEVAPPQGLYKVKTWY